MKSKKLRELSVNEIRVRASQLLSALAERNGWLRLTRVPTDESLLSLLHPVFSGVRPEDLLSRFRTRTEPKFFAAFVDREATIQQMRSRWPEAESEIVKRADDIVDGKFDLLGYRRLSFGNPVDWHREPISGKRVPSIHWSRLNFLDAELVGDKKVVWELNRHQYFASLGQAYWLTGEEKYAHTFAIHLNSWMDQNPPKLGINWASSLEVAFRSISWIWALSFFKDSPALNAQTFLRALKFLYLNARHLQTYPSTYFSPNTHLTGEALGLFYLGTMLPEFKESDRWRRTGLRILSEQLPRQVKPDGVYFEQSSYYHRYTADFYMHLFILLRANGQAMPVELEPKLRALLDHLMYITRPDGTTPLYGDDDGGRLVRLDRRRPNDFRATLSTGAALFRRSDYKYVADGAAEETLWLLGPDSLRELDLIESNEPARQSVAFKEGGYYVMRDGWTSQSNYLLFDCGPHGALNGGHAHADALSFDLAAGGRTILVDPGTYTYTGSKKFRDWFRSSFAHNTLTLDDCPSSWPGGTFSWKSKANCSLGKWITNDRFDFVSGLHDGYGVAHRYFSATLERSILFLKGDYWIMRDEMIALENHRASLLFHFDSSAKPVVDGGVRDPESGFTIKCFGDGHWLEEDTWVSHCYGQKENAKTSIFSAVFREGKDIFSFLLPGKAEIEWRVTEIPAQGGNAFAVSGANTIDLVMIRCDELVETLGFVSDSEWLWIRFSIGKVQDIVSLPEKASDSFSTDELEKLYLKLTLTETL